MRRSTVRRAKLYYIREKVAREIKRQMRRMRLMNVSSESDIEMKADRAQKESEAAAEEARHPVAARQGVLRVTGRDFAGISDPIDGGAQWQSLKHSWTRGPNRVR